ncbi:ABC-type phosphate/phosphonate transport system, periplasmic component [Burkholderiales bacterium JOSHI_001]|nr:ABC-type phosphate/phosphonate transport system, periplasmic component [Burkholderiales bacterium JOSHI_001]
MAMPSGARSQTRAAWSLAVVPQFSSLDIHRDWVPLLERLEHDSGIRLELKSAATIPKFEAEVLAGQADFAYLNPYHQVMAHRAQGYLPMVRDSQPLSGILVVRKDDPIRSVQELQGREVGFPAPNAFGASLWMRALLAEREKVQIRPLYLQTHSNVYRQVVRGKTVAGGGIAHTLEQERDEVRAELRVLMETPGAAPHPLSAHPRVPAEVRQAVTQTLLRLAASPATQPLLKAVHLPALMLADQARDYAPLERFRLERYVVLPTPGA